MLECIYEIYNLFGGVKNGHDKQLCNSVILKYLFPFQQCISMLLNEKAWLANKVSKSCLPLWAPDVSWIIKLSGPYSQPPPTPCHSKAQNTEASLLDGSIATPEWPESSASKVFLFRLLFGPKLLENKGYLWDKRYLWHRGNN